MPFLKLSLEDKNAFTVSIGEELKFFRKKKGLTAKKVAEGINVSQQQMSRYERGQSHIAIDTLLIILYKLNAPIDLFFYKVFERLKEKNTDIFYKYISLFGSLKNYPMLAAYMNAKDDFFSFYSNNPKVGKR